MNYGYLVSLSGPTATVQGVIPNIVIQLAYTSNGWTSNAFNFIGRLQDYESFTATYDVKCSGGADAIYFYFGGVTEPKTESDSSCMAFEVANDLYNGVRVLTSLQAGDINLYEYSPFNSNTDSWITMSVTYTKNVSSFTVNVFAQGALLLTTQVPEAGNWLSSLSGSYWGIGARTGGVTGNFSFRRLQVVANMSVTEAELPCYSCSAGTYSSNSGNTSDAYHIELNDM